MLEVKTEKRDAIIVFFLEFIVKETTPLRMRTTISA